MEFNINILDSFPSLNKISQKNNLLLEFNNKEYFLSKLIFQQEIIIANKSLKKFYFKIFLLSNSKKILIGSNCINQEMSKLDNNKSLISWLEFRRKSQGNNNKEINDDINYIFFDCIRLKIKITLVKTIPKTDKRIKTTKSKIKIESKTPNAPKRQEVKFKDKKNIIELNRENSFGNIENNNYLLKSQSQEQTLKLNSKGEIKSKNVYLNNIKENYDNLRIKSEEIISNEFKNLFIDNDCLLTDNNLFENYSYSTSLGDNNNKNNFIKNKIEDENKKFIDNKNDNINSDLIQSNNLITLNNCNYSNKQEKNNININNKQINTEYNSENNKNKNKKILIMKSKFKRINKLIKENKNNKEKKSLKIKSNLMNKNNNNTNKTQSLIKEKIYFNSNTYNNFYKKNKINEENIIHLETNINSNENKNIFLNNLLISYDKENNVNKNDVVEKIINSNEYDEFISEKKDYDLLYTPVFIKEIKKDLLDLEFNIALEKSISLFLSYNNHIYLFFKQKKDLFDEIKANEEKIKFLNKKLSLLNSFKENYELKEKTKAILKENDNFNLKENYLAQKKIFENLIHVNINKKLMLKSIISILLKKKPDILENIKNSNKQEKENINLNKLTNNKFIVKSPSRSMNKMKIKSPQNIKQKHQYEFMSEIKNDNSKFNNNLNNRKKVTNKNLKKNRSINYLISVGNNIEKNNIKNNNKFTENKNNFYKDNLIYYSTAKNTFYNARREKGK